MRKQRKAGDVARSSAQDRWCMYLRYRKLLHAHILFGGFIYLYYELVIKIINLIPLINYEQTAVHRQFFMSHKNPVL